MEFDDVGEARLSSLKHSAEGKTLIGLLVSLIVEQQLNLDLGIDPNDGGNIGLTIGKIRAYRQILSILEAEYDDRAQIETPEGA